MKKLLLLPVLFLIGCADSSTPTEIVEERKCNTMVHYPSCAKDGSRCINECGVDMINLSCEVKKFGDEYAVSAKSIMGSVLVPHVRYCSSWYLTHLLELALDSGSFDLSEISHLID